MIMKKQTAIDMRRKNVITACRVVPSESNGEKAGFNILFSAGNKEILMIEANNDRARRFSTIETAVKMGLTIGFDQVVVDYSNSAKYDLKKDKEFELRS